MTNYSKLQQLLDELCTEGVEFKKIWELATVGTGKSNWNEAIEDGLFPFFVRSKIVKSLNSFEFDEEAIIIPGEWWIGDIFHYVSWKYALHQRTYRISFFDKWVNTKFIYYYMFANFKAFILKYAVNATVSSIRKPMIQNFQIPIPPLPVQEEIVKILDKFTSLEAELEARKSQYEYYRDKLLAFNEEKVERKSLGEVVSLKRWVRVTKNQLEENGLFPVYQNSLTPLWFFNQFNYQKNKTFVISAWAAWSVGYSKDDFRAADDCFVMEWPNTINDKYLYYFLKNQENYLFSKVRRASIPRLWREFIEKIPIPIPPLEQQEAIVYVLDNFDKLANDLTEWLPAELKLRQQQYEYYRDLLLDFADKNGALRERES